jgi:hypothetical protein
MRKHLVEKYFDPVDNEAREMVGKKDEFPARTVSIQRFDEVLRERNQAREERDAWQHATDGYRTILQDKESDLARLRERLSQASGALSDIEVLVTSCVASADDSRIPKAVLDRILSSAHKVHRRPSWFRFPWEKDLWEKYERGGINACGHTGACCDVAQNLCPPAPPASGESLTGPTFDELGDPKEQPCCTELEKKAPVTDPATPTPGAEATTTPANLAPCPACGCKDIRVMFCFSDAGFAGRDGKHFMQCGNKKCGMCGPIRHGLDGVMLARAAWNGLCNKVNPLCFGHALSETDGIPIDYIWDRERNEYFYKFPITEILDNRRLAKRVRELMGIDGLSRLGIRDQWSVGNFRVVKSPADLFPEKEE